MKRTLGIIVLIAFAVLLFGCGKKEETKTASVPETAAPAVQETAAPTTAAAETTVPAAVAETAAPTAVPETAAPTAAAAETAAPAAVPETAAQQAAAPAQATVLDVNTAKSAAVQTVGVPEDSVCFTKAWLDYDDGIQKWEIEFVSNGNKYEVDLNASNGSLLKNSMQPVENGLAVNGGISSEQAKSAALAATGVNAADAVFTKVKSDFDDGIQKWEIEFVTSGNKYEVELNAADGSPLEMSQEMLQIAQ